jgi:hypothetical protein
MPSFSSPFGCREFTRESLPTANLDMQLKGAIFATLSVVSYWNSAAFKWAAFVEFSISFHSN